MQLSSGSEDARVAETLLRLKAKIFRGGRWSAKEGAMLDDWLQRGGWTSILAACCVVTSRQKRRRHTALQLMREAMQMDLLPPYVELLLYEALLSVGKVELVRMRDLVFRFVERSLVRRAVNLDNTIVVLGGLARAGESRAVSMLRALCSDQDPEIQTNARIVVNGLRG
jgi:hypothetical protein